MERFDFSLNPPANVSLIVVLSNGGQTKYKDNIFLGNLFSYKYFARKIPPSEEPMSMTLFFMYGINLSK